MKIALQDIKLNLRASIVVFFVAIPLCLVIALASGTPLFAGIVGGILVVVASDSSNIAEEEINLSELSNSLKM